MPDPPPPPKPPTRFDLHVIYETLRGAKATDAWVHAWVSESYDAPDAFEEALYAYATGRRRTMKSRLGKGYELYHDCVVAHLGAGKAAFIACEGGALEEVSYDTLNDRCTALAATWKKVGIEPGASVCVTLPVGVEYVVALLTALRMGLEVSTLPPHGPTYVATRLDALACDWVVTNERLRNLLRLPAERVLPVVATQQSGAPGVHVYPAEGVALRLLSPFGAPDALPEEPGALADPIETTAKSLHASWLRDGIIVLGLDPSDVVATPGFDPAQFQPLMLLTVLAAGACWAELGVNDLARDPRIVERARVTVLGVGREVREQLLARGFDALKPNVRAWFRSLTEVLEINRWDELGRLFTGSKLAGFNVMANAATGGVELWSPPARGLPLMAIITLRVWPAPARAWQTSEIAAGALTALNEAGAYTVLAEEEPAPGLPRMLLARQGDAFLFAGAIDLGPNAEIFPTDEVARVVAGIPAVRHASVLLAPGQWMNDARTVLLVFVDDARGPDGRIVLPVGVPEVRARIVREMGERFVPERIEILPLRPRFTEEGAVDHAWCRSQYMSGTLLQKARSERFILLSRLGYILAGGPRPE